ncbi:hypothetical protein [Runella sp.]|uniref:hypothetical protein n=1 Tax=Runella sp. TaxID=1960881 RepID=UPI002634F4D1|nr:hypothetical protein [Runella sp.]
MRHFAFLILFLLNMSALGQNIDPIAFQWKFWIDASKQNAFPADKAVLLNQLIVSKTSLPVYGKSSGIQEGCISGNCVNGKGELLVGNKKIIATFSEGKPQDLGLVVFPNGDFIQAKFDGFLISQGTYYGYQVPISSENNSTKKPIIVSGDIGIFYNRENSSDIFDLRNKKAYISIADTSYSQPVILTINPDQSIVIKRYNKNAGFKLQMQLLDG